MSTATCTPELFTNLIGTFITDSDMGIGAVIGSLMFNILGVSAVASFATRSVCTAFLLLNAWLINFAKMKFTASADGLDSNY